MSTLCTGLTAAGTVCRLKATTGVARCAWHTDDADKAIIAARRESERAVLAARPARVRCPAMSVSGRQCANLAPWGKVVCLAHDPAMVTAKKAKHYAALVLKQASIDARLPGGRTSGHYLPPGWDGVFLGLLGGCSGCGAPAGSMCLTMSGWQTVPHPRRSSG